MAKEKMEEKAVLDFEIDDMELPIKEVTKEVIPEKSKKTQRKTEEPARDVVSCLRNEKIIVRYIPKLSGIWGNNPKHVLAGGMAEGANRTFVVPRLSSGMFVNVLTDNEKAFLEDVMGLEYNALSIYKKVDNFWDDSNENGINKVRLSKQDNYLNLADPEDFIKYKILLANKNFIAPSLQDLQDTPKATYQFVIISEGDETKNAKTNMSATMRCYKEFGKIEDDIDTLRVIIETIDGRPTSKTAKLEFLQTKANDLIQTDSKIFLRVITDPMLSTKVLIKKSIEAGLISNRGNYLYLRSDNTPLCEANEEPTLNIAAKYLNSPKHQEVLFMLQAKLK
jgi:hypothetical protein